MHSLCMVTPKVRQVEGRKEEVGRDGGGEGRSGWKGQSWAQNHPATVPQIHRASGEPWGRPSSLPTHMWATPAAMTPSRQLGLAGVPKHLLTGPLGTERVQDSTLCTCFQRGSTQTRHQHHRDYLLEDQGRAGVLSGAWNPSAWQWK